MRFGWFGRIVKERVARVIERAALILVVALWDGLLTAFARQSDLRPLRGRARDERRPPALCREVRVRGTAAQDRRCDVPQCRHADRTERCVDRLIGFLKVVQVPRCRRKVTGARRRSTNAARIGCRLRRAIGCRIVLRRPD